MLYINCLNYPSFSIFAIGQFVISASKIIFNPILLYSFSQITDKQDTLFPKRKFIIKKVDLSKFLSKQQFTQLYLVKEISLILSSLNVYADYRYQIQIRIQLGQSYYRVLPYYLYLQQKAVYFYNIQVFVIGIQLKLKNKKPIIQSINLIPYIYIYLLESKFIISSKSNPLFQLIHMLLINKQPQQSQQSHHQNHQINIQLSSSNSRLY
ncbi:unnamed protein product (macronuclear) [Paramecium tetraurelia]|uniref:Transmembrane protein n=1 Tax=Paramecium tetraurelia TaxID=5888 RepID=A0E8R3_PARTE|nr:uncharacterized protein GSPATT00024409001 [Paramecium tetraurelia]CAK91680.1 unnamed protein product [Paramecium tetraurelia]|eukprot:XP_001459077.1 hypothetical protein (macronuclear) [Paramecium tetraurelia strain d4-2]